MRLFYYKTTSPSRNFGDELNPWLWRRLLPELNNSESKRGSQNVFIGIGTMLNDAAPEWVQAAKNVVVFSTGVGYGSGLRIRKQENWRIYCVRGPLSAAKLRLPATLAITDGAALLKRCFAPCATAYKTGARWRSRSDGESHSISYMPHFRHGNPHVFKDTCKKVGIHYIDPAESVEDVVSAISQSKLLISEAMHGAIVADTLRVPWIPVRTSPRILPFKWQDWCASVGVPYRYQVIRGAQVLTTKDWRYPLRPYLQGQGSVATLLDGVRMTDFSRRRSAGADDRVIDLLGTQLQTISQMTPYLSDENHLESLVVRLEERLADLKKDISRGLFS